MATVRENNNNGKKSQISKPRLWKVRITDWCIPLPFAATTSLFFGNLKTNQKNESYIFK